MKSIYYDDCVKVCGTLRVVVLDAPRASCAGVRTAFCRDNCYVCKLERINRATFAQRQEKLANIWNDRGVLSNTIACAAQHARRRGTVVRFASYGEALARPAWRECLAEQCAVQQDVRFLIFTRAWRRMTPVALAKMLARFTENVSIIASTDPTTTREEHAMLRSLEVQRSFFGNDNKAPDNDFMRCRKTWEHSTDCDACRACWYGMSPWFKQH